MMEVQIAKASARIDGHDIQIKALFKESDKMERKLEHIGNTVVRMSTISAVITPIVTGIIIFVMTK
tara:strand:+ start:485 stop:682 length:198 start_codon:yes stop_codon:yes gene_type:complete